MQLAYLMIILFIVKYLIDFDTFQAGFILDDIADCLRSTCNPGGEDTKSISNVFFDINFYKLSLEGYFYDSTNNLTNLDIFYLPYNIK